MEIRLASYGHVFATRERARDIVEGELGTGTFDTVSVDFGGAYASPSFIGEMLTSLLVRTDQVVVTGLTANAHRVVTSLAARLSLSDRVRVDPPLVAA